MIPEARDVAATSTSPIRILLVDDSERNLTALEAVLGDLDAEIVKATSGADALRALLRQDFALILLDVRMPGMDGFETAEMIRARDRTRSTPIIFVTAFDRARTDEIRGYGLGAVDFLSKPLIPEVLRGKVAVMIELQRKSEEVRRQAVLLDEARRRAHARALEVERRRWEEEALQARLDHERRAAHLLESANAQLKEADARKDQFLAMLGHELRNPLAPVLNAVKLMQKAASGNASFERAVAAADRQIRHMTRLLDDLLDVSRIQNGKIELKRAPFDLREALHDAILATESAIAERGQCLEFSVADEILPVDGDPVRLAQVFSNLLHNAAKYTDRGGHIRLDAARRGDDIAVTVRDDGVGIPAEMLPRIFDVFVQLDQGPDRASGGLGLGLTLVRSLIEMHGGTVVARSEGLRRGSEFEVILPAHRGPAPRAANREPAPSSPVTTPGANGQVARRRPLRIVLVDDNADIRDSLKALLEYHGHAVDEADDGRAGIELIRARNPEVALVDIGLPGMDGYQVARELRASQAATRLVAMTGYGRPEDRRNALDAGFDAHLVKPVDFDDLTRLLQQITDSDQRRPS